MDQFQMPLRCHRLQIPSFLQEFDRSLSSHFPSFSWIFCELRSFPHQLHLKRCHLGEATTKKVGACRCSVVILSALFVADELDIPEVWFLLLRTNTTASNTSNNNATEPATMPTTAPLAIPDPSFPLSLSFTALPVSVLSVGSKRKKTCGNFSVNEAKGFGDLMYLSVLLQCFAPLLL